MNATLKEVAQLANVSIATVSRVLNGGYYVSEKVRQQVIEAAHQLNYQPNAVARSLKNAKTQLIGIIVPDISNSYFMNLVRAVEETVSPTYHLLLASADEKTQKEQYYLRVFLEKRVDGMIIAPCQLALSNSVKEYNAAGIPLVSVDRYASDVEIDEIREDSYQGSYELVQHLLDFGHRNIAIITSHRTSTGIDRRRGFEGAMNDAKVKICPEYVVEGDLTEQTGYVCGKKLLMMGERRPTAVYAANNHIAVGLLTAIREFGLSVPDDISVVSFGQLPLWNLIQPRITCVIQNPRRIGELAGNILLGRMGNHSHFEKIQKQTLPTELRMGMSVHSIR